MSKSLRELMQGFDVFCVISKPLLLVIVLFFIFGVDDILALSFLALLAAYVILAGCLS
jgi:hypothetical protein